MPDIETLEGAIFNFGGTLCHSSDRRLGGLFPYAVETLLELKGRGVRLGLVTVARDREERRKDIEDRNLASIFDHIEIIGIPMPTRHKNFRPMIARLGIESVRCSVVGDMIRRDIAGGIEAGVALSVLTIENGPNRIKSPLQPDLTISCMRDLIPTLIEKGYLLP